MLGGFRAFGDGGAAATRELLPATRPGPAMIAGVESFDELACTPAALDALQRLRG